MCVYLKHDGRFFTDAWHQGNKMPFWQYPNSNMCDTKKEDNIGKDKNSWLLFQKICEVHENKLQLYKQKYAGGGKSEKNLQRNVLQK